jgi:CBS domain containing-hemolysin-like protein
MTDNFASLAHVPLQPATTFFRPLEQPRVVHLDDPAVEVMTDFKVVNPVTVKPNVPIDMALEKMKATGVRLLIVIDTHDQIVGLVTAKDIQGEKPVELVQEQRTPRSEIHVAMIMTPQAKIIALNLGSLSNARVGHVVETLRELELQHILVVENDPDSKQQRVRGLFSTSEISRQVGRDVSKIAAPAHSLAEMMRERH